MYTQKALLAQNETIRTRRGKTMKINTAALLSDKPKQEADTILKNSNSRICITVNEQQKRLKINIASPARRNKPLMLFHAYLIAAFLRLMMSLGFVCVVVGRCRSGKSLILERATPGKVINGRDQFIRSGGSVKRGQRILSSSELPEGYFTIDDIEFYDINSLTTTIRALNSRTFAVALQSELYLREVGCDIDQLLSSQKYLIINLL